MGVLPVGAPPVTVVTVNGIFPFIGNGNDVVEGVEVEVDGALYLKLMMPLEHIVALRPEGYTAIKQTVPNLSCNSYMGCWWVGDVSG